MKTLPYKNLQELFADPKRWTKHFLAVDKEGKATCYTGDTACAYCMLGGLLITYDVMSPQYLEVLDKLKKQIKTQYDEDSTITVFNDKHTYQEVLDLVTKANV